MRENTINILSDLREFTANVIAGTDPKYNDTSPDKTRLKELDKCLKWLVSDGDLAVVMISLINLKDKIMKFNLNQRVTIKPTDKGIQLMADRYNIEGLPKQWYTTYEAEKARLNENGELTIQMHEFLEYFGCLSLNIDQYVNVNIELSES